MELSVYGIHHIVARYLGLRRLVYIVSDWLVFLCSFVCCQCAEYIAQDTHTETMSDASFIAYQIVGRKTAIDAEGSCGDPPKPQHLVIDFDHFAEPEVKIPEATELRSHDKNRGDLDGPIATPGNESTVTKLINSPAPTKKSPVAHTNNEDYPTVHNLKKPQEQQPESTEFATLT